MTYKYLVEEVATHISFEDSRVVRRNIHVAGHVARTLCRFLVFETNRTRR
jgi:hypothetical protein